MVCSMKIKKMFLIPTLIIIGLIPVVFAGNDTDTMTVDVSVLATTVINIMQNSLTWTNIETGEETSMEVIDVKNVGSRNVTGMYGYVDTIDDETTNPTGSSTASDYAAGGVITFRKNDTGEDFWFTGRLEWNYTDPTGIELISLPVGSQSWGWFHNTSYEYVWAMVNGSEINDTGGCNSTDTVFRINKYNDNGTALTRDLTTGANYVEGTFEEATPDWGLISFGAAAGSPLDGYCVAAYRNCTKLYIYKYDRRTSGNTDFDGCSNVAFLNTTNATAPGYVQKINLNVRMPYGIPTGSMTQATLTIFAED